MRLVSFVLGFVLRKLGVLVAIVASLFVVYLLGQALVPALREAVADRGRLEQVAAERAALEDDLVRLERAAAEERAEAVASLETTLEDEIEAGRRDVAEKASEVEDLREGRDDVCGLLDKLAAAVLPGNACKSAERAVESADEALDTLEGGLAQADADAAVLADPDLTAQQKLDRLGEGDDATPAERELEATEAELSQAEAEQAGLEEAQASGAGWVVDQWDRTWRWLLAIALLVLVLPAVLRTLSYFVLMPMVSRVHSPIHLATGSATRTPEVHTTAALRTLTVDLGAAEVLSARSEFVRPVQGHVRSRLLYDWTAPFISFAAGLYFLSRVTGDDGVTAATLASPDDPDAYLMRIDFEDHPGLVMHPKHVVGVIGTPRLETRWRWGIQSFATWQVRYILFSGAGSLIVQGVGDVVATNPRGRSTRMEQNLVMGFDSRLSKGVNRTEVFWPYLRGRTPLVDDEFDGVEPLFWQKSSTEGPRNPIARAFDSLFSALGKLLGF